MQNTNWKYGKMLGYVGATGLVMSLAGISNAATQWWDASNASGLTAGNGNWSTGGGGNNAKWATSATPGTTAPGNWVNGNDAIFETSGSSTVTVNSTSMTVNSMTFNGTGYAVAAGAGTLTLVNTAAAGATVTTNADASITELLLGSDGLIKQGSAILTLSGGSSYTGTTSVNAGTLRLSGGSALADANAVSLANTSGVTLDVVNSETIGSIAGGGGTGGNVTLGSSVTLTLAATSGSTTYNGAVSGASGSLNKSAGSTLILGGSNNYGGGTTAAGGILTAASSSALGSGNLSVTTGTIELGNAAPLTVSLSSGTYSQGTNGKTTFNTNGSTMSQLSTLGTASLAGAARIAGTLPGTSPNTSYTLLNTGTRSGTYDSYEVAASLGTNSATNKMVDFSRLDKVNSTITDVNRTANGSVKVLNFFDGFEKATYNATAHNNTFADFWQPSAGTGEAVPLYLKNFTATNVGTVTINTGTGTGATSSAAGKNVGVMNSTQIAKTISDPAFKTNSNVGPITHFGGASATAFPSGGSIVAQADVYLDPNWANNISGSNGTTNGVGFDYSVAIGDQSGNPVRDFILHVFKTAPGNTSLQIKADNNTNFFADPTYANRNWYTATTNNSPVTNAGWYTVQHIFSDVSGTLQVQIKVLNSAGTTVFDQVTSKDSDATSGLGGLQYGWFTNVDISGGLPTDNFKVLYSNTSLAGGTLLLANGTGGTTMEAQTPGQVISLDGMTNFDLAGTSQGESIDGYDSLHVYKGGGEMAGDLNVALANGFVPDATDSFTLLQADTALTGQFANIVDGTILTADGHGMFDVNLVGGNTLVLDDFQFVPEPASVALLGLGTWALAGTRFGRRRRRAV